MDTLLNLLSIIGTTLALLGILFLVQSYTVGLLPFFKKHMYKSISRGDLIFCISTLVIFFSFFNVQSPY